MIRPPPETFGPGTLRYHANLEASEAVSAGRILGWAAAVVLTLGVHVGLYLALTHRPEMPPAPQEMPAAVMIDMAPEPTVARSNLDNAQEGPPAPDSDHAEPERMEAPPPPDPEPIVQAAPPPPEIKPQAVLSPKPPKKDPPKPKPKKVEKTPTEKKPEKPVNRQDRPAVASRSGGGPKSDQHTADRTAAAAAGSAVSQASRATWQNEMRARIVRAKRFPPGAAGAAGVAVVSVAFSGNGSITGARLIGSSGNAALDAEAVAVMYRAAPFPPPPGGQPITQTIPINFSRR